jgi:hypothetical protein
MGGAIMRAMLAMGLLLLGCGGEPDNTKRDTGDGDDGSSEETGGAVGDGDGDGEAEPVCRSVDTTNATSLEKLAAGFCFGVAYPDDAYFCNWYPADNAVECVGSMSAYVVLWTGDDFGDVYDLDTETHLATISQAPTGEYVVEWDDGLVGECVVNGDVATLCVLP